MVIGPMRPVDSSAYRGDEPRPLKDRLGSLLSWVLGVFAAGALYLLFPESRTVMRVVSGFALLALLAAVAVLAAVQWRRRQDA